MILNMRSRDTAVWYVPTARCIFDVDTNKITWEDLPYLVPEWLRSRLWGVAFRV